MSTSQSPVEKSRSKRFWSLVSRRKPNRAPDKETPQVDVENDVKHVTKYPSEPNLGRHADEDHMPRWLVRVLRSGDQVTTRQILRFDADTTVSMDLKPGETPGLVPTLAMISAQNVTTSRARYCSAHVHHVAKQRREGSFCGYRNVQMLISYIRNADARDYRQFDRGALPSIFQLQDMIERAWDKGFNAESRDEVGKLRMTRKFIGTSEVEALFLSLDIPVTRRAFVPTTEKEAHELLLDYVARYFEIERAAKPATASALSERSSRREVLQSFITSKPPLFLQRQGHSMTIVGVDEDTNGARSLIVFDPKYKPALRLKEAAVNGGLGKTSPGLLKAHQYGASYLSQYGAFELVQLDDTTTIPSRPP